MHKSNSLAHQLEVAKFENLQLAASLSLISELNKSYECLLENNLMPQYTKDLIQSMSELHDRVFESDAVQNAINNYTQKDQ